MPVGVFPGVDDYRRRTIKAPDNPMDRCTIFSIYPREIDEVKHTIQPGRFIIPPGSYEKPSSLVVGPSSWWKEIDNESPLLEIPTSSILIADSVVKDYCNGLLGCNMGDEMPGLFYIPGNVGLVTLLKEHKSDLDRARDNQKRWYVTLVKLADGLWSQSQGNPLAISDDMRLAASELGQNTKEWLQDFQATETIRCVACGAMRNPLFPMCGNCRTVIDQKKFDEMGLKKAQ
jgi:hypothetical protein